MPQRIHPNVLWCLLPTLIPVVAPAHAESTAIPTGGSQLYYRIGGGEPVAHAANPYSRSLRIAVGGTAGLNYSCGRFDASATIAHLLNNLRALPGAASAQIQAGIAAMPMYILQRASPGMYELFQTYRRMAEVNVEVALRSCQQMEQQIRQGGDPYEDWAKLARGESWKVQSQTTTDVVTANATVEANGGRAGVTWVGGLPRGGQGQPPIEVIRDLVQAGYATTMNQPTALPPTTVFSSFGPNATRLTAAFQTPKAAADWATAVLGDKIVSTCDESGCPGRGGVAGTGLLPKLEGEVPNATAQLQAVVTGLATPDRAALEAAGAPGIAVTRELVDALRSLPPTDRDIALGRLSMEIAQARVIDRALLVRSLLLTGAGSPEVGFAPAQTEARQKIQELDRDIDDVVGETRIRRELVSTTAGALLEAYRTGRLQSIGHGTQGPVDANPLNNGRVQ